MDNAGLALSVRNLSKTFGHKCAVDALSFSVKKGEVFGFLGPNGAGKTTSLRMILGLFEPDAGDISILGAPNALSVAARIGYLPEERGLYQNMTPIRVITYLATLRGMPERLARQKALALLEQTGLGEATHKPIKALSKGMAQKVQVLATLAHEPEFIILDEPFSGLDPVNQGVLEDLILSAKARGATVVFSTHVMQHAERLCDRLVVIAQGQARFEGTPQEARALLPTRLRVVATMPLAWATQQSQTQAGLFVNEVALNTRAELDGLLKALASSGAHVHDLSVLEPSLHAVFVHLVGALMPETSMATSPALKTHSPSHTSELPA